MRAAVVTACLVLTASPVTAQSDPIRCWWRTTAGAVSIGAPFEATLTCAVREQEATRTVPDETRLAAAVVPLAPFEVLGGSHPEDLRSPSHRFLQYQYSLRVIDRDVIGRDVRFPDVQVPYRVHALTNGEWMPGRERTYTIPGHPVRVLSLVPLDARDIRDATEAGFATLETLRFRARAFDIAFYALTILGVIVAVPAVMSLSRRRRDSRLEATDVVPSVAIARATRAELALIAEQSARGWNPELAARALSALRLAAATALRRDVATHGIPTDSSAGRLAVTRGIWQKRHHEISSAMTPAEILMVTSQRTPPVSAARLSALEALAAGMTMFTRVLYAETFTSEGLDEAFAAAHGAATRLEKS